MIQFILASASPRRAELFRRILPYFDATFSVHPAEADETLPEDISPDKCAEILSRRKAKAVAAKYPDAVVIGADTTVIFDGKIYGKPDSPEDAARMLAAFSGNTHHVITDVTIIAGKNTRSFSSDTAVTFYPLSPEEIQSYIQTGEPLDKAGAYGIQENGAFFVQKIDGDYYNVVGLPIAPLLRTLQDLIPERPKEATK